MGVDLAAIHEALADQVKANISDDWNVSAWPNGGMPLPYIEVWPGEPYTDPHPEGASFCEAAVNLLLRVRMNGADGETAFKRMARALSSGTGHGSSVINAVEQIDPTLGGIVNDTVIGTTDWTPEVGQVEAVALISVACLVERD